MKRFHFAELPKIRKLKSLNNRLFVIAGNGFFEINGLKSKCILNKHPLSKVEKCLPMDILYWQNQYYASFYPDKPLLTWKNELKWEVDLNKLSNLLIQNGKYKTIMTSIVFENKLFGSTGDNRYFSVDKNGATKFFSFVYENHNNYVVWDFSVATNKLILAIGNTNNLETGYIYTHNDQVTQFDISKHNSFPFFWTLTFDPLNNGIWANSLNKGVYFYPQFQHNIELPIASENYLESKDFEFTWNKNQLLYKRSYQSNWVLFRSKTNIRSVLQYKNEIIIHCEDGICIIDAESNSLKNHIFSIAFEHVFIQHNILYASNFFGPIWTYDLSKKLIINHLDQSKNNFNSIAQSNDYTILHSDNDGYFLIQNDSLFKLKIDIPIDKSKFNFYLSGNSLMIQDGKNLICCEIDFIKKEIHAKQNLNLKSIFPFINIEWIKGTPQGLWLGNSTLAMHFSINPNGKLIKMIEQYYLGNSKEIQFINIEKDHISICRSNFVQKLNFNKHSESKKLLFEPIFQKNSNISNYNIPYFNHGENFNFSLFSSNYIVSAHGICEVILSNKDSIFSQNFREANLPIWVNNLSEGIYQISLKSNTWQESFPIKIESPVLKRTEFWILILIACFIFIFFLYNQQIEKLQLKEKINNLELVRIRLNMNPHFIFNVMNFVQAMIVKDDKKMALKATTRLSQINRLFLETSQKETISLKEELDFALKYIQLEKMRFEKDKDFKFNINIEEGINTEIWMLPPLILQPLLENALKHGVLMLKNDIGFIHINISITAPNEILILVQNSGLKKSSKRASGTLNGLKLVSERIDLFNKKYKKHYNAEFTSDFEGDLYNCCILLKKY